MKRDLALGLLLALASFAAAAQDFSRAGWREYSLQPYLLTAERYDFGEGASARVDGGAGLGFGLAQHLNDHFALGIDFSLSTFDLNARVAPAAGNAGAAFDENGTVDRGSILIHGTWHVLASRTTPFLTAGIGATHLDVELEEPPPSGGCWRYPFWGRFCSSELPTSSMTRLTYVVGAGLRHDFSREPGFVRLLVLGEFIDWSGDPERLETVQVRADFGVKF